MMGWVDLLERCPKCGVHDWVNYGEGYIECATCGYVEDLDNEMCFDEDEIIDEDDN
jgi:transcription initiation factor TFIIIB Brf1 subunit/transcription initiation factor TFIIB